MDEIILASGSPRRRELLTLIGVPFKVIKSDAPEIITKTDPGEIVMELSMQKALDVYNKITEGSPIVLGADTIVCLDGKVLGKPADREDAKRMIRALQGRTHSPLTCPGPFLGGCREIRGTCPSSSPRSYSEIRGT